MQIHISKITHRDAQRLLVEIPYTNHNIQQIRQIPGATFSRTLNSWHIPFTKDAYSKLSALFPLDEFIKVESTQPDDPKPADLIAPSISLPISVEPNKSVKISEPFDPIKTNATKSIPNSLSHLQTNTSKSAAPSANSQQCTSAKPFIESKPQSASILLQNNSQISQNSITDPDEIKQSVTHGSGNFDQTTAPLDSLPPAFFPTPTYYESITLEVAARRLILRMPKNDTDVQFVLTFRFTVWNAGIRAWIIPHYKSNLDIIIKYFGARMDSVIQQPTYDFTDPSSGHRILQKETLLVIKTRNNRLRVLFTYNVLITAVLKTIPYTRWDTKNKWWSVPFSEAIKLQIKTAAINQHLDFQYEEEATDENKASRVTPYDIPNYRSCPDNFIEKLQEMRYSPHTIQTYTSLFEEFINFYHRFDISRIDEHQIIAFLRHLVTERKVSISYQNQSINAIKFYYERVLGSQRKIYLVDRPRTEKTLPIVLSPEETQLILVAPTNLKHRAILTTIYSAGLRVSESIALKKTDIDSKRMQIRVSQAKGKKDRYTLLSPKTLDLLRRYVAEFKPKEYLFEGLNNQPYSDRSIQSILKAAVKTAGIEKRITVHTLRHSFATHLLENGTDLRYIQSLLGHESSRTTEIYTHITTKGFDQIKSPLDNLDI